MTEKYKHHTWNCPYGDKGVNTQVKALEMCPSPRPTLYSCLREETICCNVLSGAKMYIFIQSFGCSAYSKLGYGTTMMDLQK